MTRIDSKGRLGLPCPAVDTLGKGPIELRWHRLALLAAPDPTGTSKLDDRGRLLVPVSLREPGGHYLIGTNLRRHLVVMAPVNALDAFGDVLAGSER